MQFVRECVFTKSFREREKVYEKILDDIESPEISEAQAKHKKDIERVSRG